MLIALFWTGFILTSFASLRALIFFCFALLAFNAFNCIPASFNLIPAMILIPFLFFYMIFQRGYLRFLLDSAFRSDALGYLTAYVMVSLIVTMTTPLFFDGVMIVGLNSSHIEPLEFGITNLTQIYYLVSSYVFAVSISALLMNVRGREYAVQGILIGGTVVFMAGVMDMLTFGTSILAPVRSASYQIMKDNTFVDIGMNRVIGFSPEASAYAPLTLGFAAILLLARPTQMVGGRWKRTESVLGGALAFMTYLTTSTSGYVGLAVLMVIWLTATLARMINAASARERADAQTTMLGLAGAMLLVFALLLLRPDVVDRGYRVLDTIVFSKGQTSSYIVRASWNRDSLHALSETYGYGLGLGATRTSSWPVALITSSGVIGALLMGIFLVGSFLGAMRLRCSPMERVARGASLATIVSFTPLASAATSADFGVCVAISFGLIAAGRMQSKNLPRGKVAVDRGDGLPVSEQSQPISETSAFDGHSSERLMLSQAYR